MKRLLLTILIVLLMASMGTAKNWEFATFGRDNSLTFRLGHTITTDVYGGGELAFLKINEVPGSVGLWGLYEWSAASVTIPLPLGLDWLPALTGVPYVGGHAGFDILNEGTYRGIEAGALVNKILDLKWSYDNTAYGLDNVGDSKKFSIGLVFKF